MNVAFEIVKPDKDSCFRLLHQNVRVADYVWEYHYHPEFEIVFVPEGSGTRHVGNYLGNYQNGDLVMIGSNLPHAGFGLNCPDLHEQFVLQIKEEVVRQAIGPAPEMQTVEALLERARYGILFTGQTKENIGWQMMQMVSMPPFERYLAMLRVLYGLAVSEEYVLLNEEVLLSSSISRHRGRLQKVFTYVERHFEEEIDIKKVAALAGLSVPSFCNFFKKTTHITFTEFTNHYRIQRVCLLLRQDKTIAEACYACGFNNVTYFNKLFKRTMGKSPSEFKREMKI